MCYYLSCLAHRQIAQIRRLAGRPFDCPDPDFLVVRRSLHRHHCRIDVRGGPVTLFVAPVAGSCLDKAFSIGRFDICAGDAPAISGATALSGGVFVSDAWNQPRPLRCGDDSFPCRSRYLDRIRGATQQADSVVDTGFCPSGVDGHSRSLAMQSPLSRNRGRKCFCVCRWSDEPLLVTKV